MKVIQTRTITVFGREIAKEEVIREYGASGGGSERKRGSMGIMPMNSDYLAPILAEAIKRANGKMRTRFRFEEGNELMVDANIGFYEGVQGLKGIFAFPNGAANVVLGFSALTDAYSEEGLGASGVLKSHILDIVNENWETIKSPAS